MKNLSARFSKIRQKIRRGDEVMAIELLTFLQKDIEDKFLTLHKTIEVKGKKVLPKDQWQLEIKNAEGSTHRLTINPTTGRVTLKVAQKASEAVREDLKEFVKEFIEQALGDIAPVTVRGKISFDRKGSQYTSTLYSESKKFRYSFKYKV